MDAAVCSVFTLLVILGFVGLGAYLYHVVFGSPTERERALEAQIEGLKRANFLGAAYFDAQQQMRSEMADAARARTGRGRANVGRSSVVDGDWSE